jgi:putative thioredoxin
MTTRASSSHGEQQKQRNEQQRAQQTNAQEKIQVDAEQLSSDNIVVEIDSMESFQIQLQRSANMAVIIDCYADWCQPCKVLTPLLEKVVRQFGGQARLFKLNVDNVPDVAAQFQIEVLPTLFGIVRGNQVVAQTTGVRDENFLKDWVGKIVEVQYQGLTPEQRQKMQAAQQQAAQGYQASGTPEQQLDMARQYIQHGQHDIASQIFSSLINNENAKDVHPKAYAGLIMCLLGTGQIELAEQTVKQLQDAYPVPARVDPEVRQSIALFDITKQYNSLEGATNVEVDQKLHEKLAQDPNDHDARYKLAISLFSNGNTKKAIDELLTIIRKNKTWNEGAAKKLLLTMFDCLGPNDKIAQEGRKRLANLMF